MGLFFFFTYAILHAGWQSTGVVVGCGGGQLTTE